MDRHSFMLKQYSEQQLRKKKEMELWKARHEVEINWSWYFWLCSKAWS